MNLYLISQSTNNNYDTYDAAVVAAPNENTARSMNPADGTPISDWLDPFSSWCCSPDDVQVKLIGVASEGQSQGLILGSFNAG